MSKDTVINREKPERFIDDPLTDILRKGARKLLTEALEVEIEIFITLCGVERQPWSSYGYP